MKKQVCPKLDDVRDYPNLRYTEFKLTTTKPIHACVFIFYNKTI